MEKKNTVINMENNFFVKSERPLTLDGEVYLFFAFNSANQKQNTMLYFQEKYIYIDDSIPTMVGNVLNSNSGFPLKKDNTEVT